MVRVRFRQASRSDLYKTLGFQLRDRSRTGIAHRCAQTTNDLVGDRINFAAVWNLAFDTFWHQLVLAAHIGLEVAVLGIRTLFARQTATLHRPHRSHAAVALVLLTADDDNITRRFLSTSKHGAQHHAVCACRQGFRDIAGVLHAAIGNDGNPRRTCDCSSFQDGGDLWGAHAGDHTRRTNRTWPDTHLDAISTGVDHRLRGLARGQVATNDVDLREGLFYLRDHLENPVVVRVSRVDDEHVHTRFNQGFSALEGLLTGTDTCSDQQAAFLILGRVRELLGFHEVFDRDQPDELVVIGDDRKFFHFVFAQQAQRFLLAHAFFRNHQRRRRHHVLDQTVRVCLETHVTVGANTHQVAFAVDNR